jgi:nuclear transport factor 2 (NTF2) superfamily protein
LTELTDRVDPSRQDLYAEPGLVSEGKIPMRETDAHAAENPRDEDAARALVRHVESLFMPWNIDALVDGFTEDCVVRFGTVAEFRGHEKLRAFFIARRTRQLDYRLTKRFRALSGDTIANVWTGEWRDAESGAPMRGFGVETWRMRMGRIAVWEAAFNVARADDAGDIASMLRQDRPPG